MESAYINGRLSREQSDAVAAVQKNAREALRSWKDAVVQRHVIVGLKVGALDTDGMRLYNELVRIEGLLVQFNADIDKLKKDDE